MVGREKLHGVEEHGSKPERLCDAVRGVEVDVRQDVGHGVVDDVPQSRQAVHQQRDTLRRHTWVEGRKKGS